MELTERTKCRKKKDKNQSALKHGAYSREDMLPGEKLRDYEAMREAHYEDWAPDGVTEQYLVDDLCKLRWKKQRMDRYDQICLRQRHAEFRKQNNVNFRRSILKGLGAEFSEAASVEVVEQIISRLSPSYAQSILEGVPREKCKDPAQWGQEIGKVLSKLEVEDQLEGPDLFAAIVNPDLMAAEISRSDRLDEAIDRKIKQIMQVKASKQVFPSMRKNARSEPKLINPPARADRLPAVVSENKPEPATQTEIAVRANSNAEKEAFPDESPVVTEGVRIVEGGPAAVQNMRKNVRPEPKPISPRAHADSQHAAVSENEPEPAMQTKIAVSANSNAEKEAFLDQSPVVIEGNNEGGPAADLPNITEKEHLDIEHVKVEFFAKPLPRTLDEVIDGLEEFCADCEKAMVSNAPRIPVSSPTATSI
jgi:hypothetical protein